MSCCASCTTLFDISICATGDEADDSATCAIQLLDAFANAFRASEFLFLVAHMAHRLFYQNTSTKC